MLKGKRLPNTLWAEVVHTAVYILNRSPTKSVRNKTPFEAWSGRKPTVGHLKVFGSIAYALNQSPNKDKFDEKGEKMLFVGYSDESKGYRLLNPENKKIVVSRDVIFDETTTWIWPQNESSLPTTIPDVFHMESGNNDQQISSSSTTNTSDEHNNTSSTESCSLSPHSSPSSSRSVCSSSARSDTPSPPPVRRTERVSKPPDRFGKWTSRVALTDEACDFALFTCEPHTFDEAAKEDAWRKAMDDEIAMIEKNKTWQLVDLPKGKEVIGLKWVYKTKYNEDGSIQKFKARLVAKGYAQQPGVDFNETFAPVARIETIRLVLALAAQLELKVYQLDVKSAFLNGELEEEVYVEQPQGYEVKGKEDKVYRLKKALYGLKQAPRAWNSKTDSYFLNHGFTKSPNEPSLYIKRNGQKFLIVCLYVDDLIYTGNDRSMMVDFKRSMMKEFEMTDLGLMKYFLGIQVKQAKGEIIISQEKYAQDLLRKFHMKNCKPVATPMAANKKLKQDDGAAKVDASMYRSLVESLLYLTHTRPDLTQAVSMVSRFLNNPSKLHFGAAK